MSFGSRGGLNCQTRVPKPAMTVVTRTPRHLPVRRAYVVPVVREIAPPPPSAPAAGYHAVVMPDADLDFATNHLTAAGYGSAGQRCMTISVAVAVGDVADEFVERLRKKALEVKVGPGLDPDSEMGPVITAASRDRIVDCIATTEADTVLDGRELKIDGDGFGSARRCSRMSPRTCPPTPRRSSGPCWPSCASRRWTLRSS